MAGSHNNVQETKFEKRNRNRETFGVKYWGQLLLKEDWAEV